MKTFWQTIIWGALAGAVIGGASFLPHAHAEAVVAPSICATFDASPTFDTVNVVMRNVVGQGRNIAEAAQIVVDTVADSCPRHIALLQRYVEAGHR